MILKKQMHFALRLLYISVFLVPSISVCSMESPKTDVPEMSKEEIDTIVKEAQKVVKDIQIPSKKEINKIVSDSQFASSESEKGKQKLLLHKTLLSFEKGQGVSFGGKEDFTFSLGVGFTARDVKRLSLIFGDFAIDIISFLWMWRSQMNTVTNKVFDDPDSFLKVLEEVEDDEDARNEIDAPGFFAKRFRWIGNKVTLGRRCKEHEKVRELKNYMSSNHQFLYWKFWKSKKTMLLPMLLRFGGSAAIGYAYNKTEDWGNSNPERYKYYLKDENYTEHEEGVNVSKFKELPSGETTFNPVSPFAFFRNPLSSLSRKFSKENGQFYDMAKGMEMAASKIKKHFVESGENVSQEEKGFIEKYKTPVAMFGFSVFRTLLAYKLFSGVYYSLWCDYAMKNRVEKLFDWAERTKDGLLIFIDEAEVFLADRSNPATSDQSKKLTDMFLSRVEKPSAKNIMFVLATNHAKTLDAAVLSRLGYFVKVDKPAQVERVKLFKLYAEKLADHGVALDRSFESNLAVLAKEADGLVGRDIEELMNKCIKSVHRNGKNSLDIRTAKEVLVDYVESRENIQVLKGYDKVVR